MGTLPSRMEVTVIINILLLFFLALVAQVEAQISFGSSQSSQQTAAVSRPSQSNSRPIFSQRPTSNQSGNFIVKNRNQQLESNTRHGCCFFANNICNAPCAGRLCSAQCTDQLRAAGGHPGHRGQPAGAGRSLWPHPHLYLLPATHWWSLDRTL